MSENEAHECDLFVMSGFTPYSASKSLEAFALRGDRNLDGWGIGSFIQGKADVVRSAESAIEQGRVTPHFANVMHAVRGEVILGHLRLASRGERVPENNHPFTLPFWGCDWLFMHNGTARRRNLVPPEDRLLSESTSDSPRVFEFIRKQMLAYRATHEKGSLIGAVRDSVRRLLEVDPDGKYNLVLSNGHLTFVVIHHRQFNLATRLKSGGDVLLLSTLALQAPEVIEFERKAGTQARLLVINGPTLVWNTDL